jgi:hypothetical protein
LKKQAEEKENAKLLKEKELEILNGEVQSDMKSDIS